MIFDDILSKIANVQKEDPGKPVITVDPNRPRGSTESLYRDVLTTLDTFEKEVKNDPVQVRKKATSKSMVHIPKPTFQPRERINENSTNFRLDHGIFVPKINVIQSKICHKMY